MGASKLTVMEKVASWLDVEQSEEDGVLSITISVDKAALVREAIPALLEKLSEKKPDEPARRQRKPAAQQAPGNLPSQAVLPLPEVTVIPASAPATETAPAAPQSPAAAVVPPVAHGQPALANPLHGVAVVTNPGETMAQARARVLAEKRAEAEASRVKATAGAAK